MYSSNSSQNVTPQQLYRQLELLPPAEDNCPTPFTFGLNAAWKLLLHLLVEELVEEQQVEYLERCLTADQTAESNGLKRFLTLIA